MKIKRMFKDIIGDVNKREHMALKRSKRAVKRNVARDINQENINI